jgi:dynein heavy chain
LVINKSYGVKDLKEDIKIGFDNAGRLGKPHTFLMTDSEVKNEDFLEYINMILSTGEIPGLLAKDEREIVLADVRNDYVKLKNLKEDPNPSELWNYFVDRVRDNYHIVLAFSPVG